MEQLGPLLRRGTVAAGSNASEYRTTTNRPRIASSRSLGRGCSRGSNLANLRPARRSRPGVLCSERRAFRIPLARAYGVRGGHSRRLGQTSPGETERAMVLRAVPTSRARQPPFFSRRDPA